MKFPPWNRKKTPSADLADPATKVTTLVTGDEARRPSRWKYTEVEEPERFSPVPHELGVVMQGFESFEQEIFERIDAIHAAGGLDLGHFDIFDGYLARERESVEASLVHERDARRKTAALLTAISHKRTSEESLRVRPLRAEHDRIMRLREEVIAELRGHEHTPPDATDLIGGLPVPKPLAIPADPSPDPSPTPEAMPPSGARSIGGQALRTVREPSHPETFPGHNHRPFKEFS